jgi:GNAT superfamily N-acetyltransferase
MGELGDLRVHSHAERPELGATWLDVILPAWPAFMHHDAVCNRYWGGLFERFPECQLYLCDADDAILGVANAVPVAWDGTVAGLPGGVDDMLLRTFGPKAADAPPTALSALQAVVVGERRGRGLSAEILRAMRDVAARRGYESLIAPVRPTWKARYPLAPIERYIAWTRDDGLPLDPWLRVHRRLGAEILGIAERSMLVEGTVAEWESWADMPLPESGTYVVPGALVPVEIDRERDLGRYVEPNVWMRHPVA